MFELYLHPDLVLFGRAFDPQIKCLHPIQLVDGQMVVHQIINRSSTITQNRCVFQTAKELASLHQQIQDQYNEEEEMHDQQFDGKQYEDQNQYEDDDDDDDDDDAEGQYEEEDNPYEDKYYNYTTDQQYRPQQLQTVFNFDQKSPPKIDHLPLATTISSKIAKKKKEKKEGEQDQDEWLTEQQQQDYVMMKQVGGLVVTDI